MRTTIVALLLVAAATSPGAAQSPPPAQASAALAISVRVVRPPAPRVRLVTVVRDAAAIRTATAPVSRESHNVRIIDY